MASRTPPSAEARRLERKEQRHERRRTLILDAARRLLASAGIERFTVTAVAEEAGVSKSSVYYYFEAKEDVVGALAVESLRAEVEVLLAAIESAPSGIEALGAVVRAYVDHHVADFDAFRVLNVWPEALGIGRRILESDVYALSRRVNDRLEARIAAESSALAEGAHPRRLANIAWTTAHGLVSLASSLDAIGGDTLFSIAELRDEAACALVRGARRG